MQLSIAERMDSRRYPIKNFFGGIKRLAMCSDKGQ